MSYWNPKTPHCGALIGMLSQKWDLALNLDNNIMTDLILLDFAKAVDKVNHSKFD